MVDGRGPSGRGLERGRAPQPGSSSRCKAARDDRGETVAGQQLEGLVEHVLGHGRWGVIPVGQWLGRLVPLPQQSLRP